MQPERFVRGDDILAKIATWIQKSFISADIWDLRELRKRQENHKRWERKNRMKEKLLIAVLGLMWAGAASAQCVAVVNPSPNVLTDAGPVHNMAFLSSNNPLFYTTPTASPTLYFPGAKWIQFGQDVDAGYVNLGPNWTGNGACPRVWSWQPISSMQLRVGSNVEWSAGPNPGLTIGCTDGDSDDSSCYFSVFAAASARSPQIAVYPGEILYAYDCFHAYVIGSSPTFSANTATRCGVIKLVIQ